MGVIYDLMLHPSETSAVLEYKFWRQPLHRRNPASESAQLQRCYYFLDETSRSFAAVIKELSNELRDAVMLFYLVLRGLDTIEDDMTIPLERKLPLLRSFYEKLEQPGWTFTQNGKDEKDRQLLVEFDVVIAEYGHLMPAYRRTIADITKEMGSGMAHYAEADIIVDTLDDYDRYCHYVAGLVGEGLSRLFASSGLEDKCYADLTDLSNSMGLFLQKTNIMRDYREDLDDGRVFWPKVIWSRYAAEIGDLVRPESRAAALDCLSHMTCNALEHATDCLVYLSGLHNQAVFNFCAIPQVMAIATMALCFRNPAVFERNVKIRKGQACKMIMQSSNLHSVTAIFCKYSREIQRKNHPSDPNYLRIGELCGQIEAWTAARYGSSRQLPVISDGRRDDNGDRDALKLMLIVVIFWLTVSTIMLFAAQSMGARFDLAWEELITQLSRFRASATRPVADNAAYRVEL
ncbi:bifunctional farnesyl-diphosphate farnesyltransferase/squalene synthase [Savitreella phatthalungensis]